MTDQNSQPQSKNTRLILFLKKFLIGYSILLAVLSFFNWSADICGYSQYFNTMLPLSVLKEMGFFERIIGWFVDIIGVGLFMVVLLSLYQLLGYVQKGEPFSSLSIALCEKIARFYLFTLIYEPFNNTVMSIITSWHHGSGNRTLTISFGTNNLNAILLGLCLYLIVFLIKQAHQISEEQRMVI